MDKSAVKKAYKQAKRTMGVYRIRNARSDKSFVGFSTDMPAKINRHKAELKFGTHRNAELLGEWNLLGEASFRFEVLDELGHEEGSEIDPLEELRVLAEMWVRKLENAGCAVVSI